MLTYQHQCNFSNKKTNTILIPIIAWGTHKVMQHIFFGPILLDKNDILRAVSLKCPAFMHIGARFPAG